MTKQADAACPCGCGYERTYEDSNYWYWRDPSWLWYRAARVVCWLFGCKLNCRHGDCYRCG